MERVPPIASRRHSRRRSRRRGPLRRLRRKWREIRWRRGILTIVVVVLAVAAGTLATILADRHLPHLIEQATNY